MACQSRRSGFSVRSRDSYQFTEKECSGKFHFGDNPRISLIAESRKEKTDPVGIAVETDTPFELVVNLPQGAKTLAIPAGKTSLTVP